MHMAATREPHFSSSLLSPETSGGGWWWGGCPIKAAIEIKHKALNSEQLNGPTIIAVGVLVWSLSLRKQEASRGGP